MYIYVYTHIWDHYNREENRYCTCHNQVLVGQPFYHKTHVTSSLESHSVIKE